MRRGRADEADVPSIPGANFYKIFYKIFYAEFHAEICIIPVTFCLHLYSLQADEGLNSGRNHGTIPMI